LEETRAQQAAEGGRAAAWRLGWVLVAMGRYGEALAALDAAEGRVQRGDAPAGGPDVVAAAACATRASLLRQVGLHERAEAHDRAGLAHLGAGGPGPAVRDRRPAGAAAACAASAGVAANLRVGLVADAVGRGLADELSSRLADAERAVAVVVGARQRIRLGWVAGEVAMVGQRWAGARARFETAAASAGRLGWRRHESKSLLFAGAACAAAGDAPAADRRLRRALDLAEACGARPLRWPCELLLADLEQRDEVRSDRLRAAAQADRDALLATLPEPLGAEARRHAGATG
jgi:hypothetical protein